MHNITKTLNQSDNNEYRRGLCYWIRHRNPEVLVTTQFADLQGIVYFIVDK